MHKQKRSYRLWLVLPLVALVATTVLAVVALLHPGPAQAAAGINEQINYQGRLLTGTGAVVPDGSYNMEFKIVQDGDGCNPTSGTFPCSGTVKWTETRDSSNKVLVKNGYFSVYLGSVTAFASNIDWNQDTLWLSINIGGTGSPSYDGVMKPLTRFSSTPYALNSKQLGGIDKTGFVQIGPSSVQTDATTNSTIFINKTASGNLLQLQSSAADVFTLSGAGDQTFGNNANHTLSVAARSTNATGRSLTVSGGAGGSGATGVAGGDLVLQGGAAAGTTGNANGGNVTLDGGAAVNSGTKGYVILQGSSGNVGIGTSSPTAALAVGGGTASSDNRVIIKGISNNDILALENFSTTKKWSLTVDGNNFRIGEQGVGYQFHILAGGHVGIGDSNPSTQKLSVVNDSATTIGTAIKAAASQTANLLQLQDSSANILASFTPQGASNQRQQLSIYNTLETTPTNYERLGIYADNSNSVFRIESQNGGSGTLRNLALQGGGGNVGIGTTGPDSTLHLVGGACIETSDTGCAAGSGQLVVNSTGASGLLRITDTTATARDVLTIADGGATTFRNQTDSSSAFVVQNAAGTETMFTIDSSARGSGGGNLVKIGNSTGTDTATTVLQVDGNAGALTSNLSALNGGLYYNSTIGHLQVIEGGVVKTVCNLTDAGCGTGGATTLQTAYTNSAGAAPSILTTSANKAVTVQTATTSGITAGNELFGVRASHASDTIGNSLFTVNSAGVGINIGGTGNPATTADLSFGSGADRTINVITQGASTNGNNLSITSGAGGSGVSAGGNLNLKAGASGDSGVSIGGQVTVQGGDGYDGGGLVTVQGGTAGSAGSGSVGGNVVVQGGTATVASAAGGNTYVLGGTPGSGGTAGNVLLAVTSGGAAQGKVGIGTTSTPSQLLSVGGTTGNLTVDSSGNITSGTITSGLINSQTISSAANFTGTLAVAGNLTQTAGSTISAGTGFKINGATATAGNYLRGDGTNFVANTIQAADIPSLSGTYLRNVPAAGTDNTIAPTANGVVALTVNGTSGTAATAVSIVQAGNADALNISSSGTGNLLKITDSTATARDVLTIADGGATTFRNQTNSTAAFQVQNAAGTDIFTVDATNAKIGTSNQTAGSTNSSALTFKSGDVSGATSNSGDVVIDSGSATGTAGNISIGTGAYAHNATIGNTTGGSNSTLQAGSTSGTITLEAPTINIGNSGSVHNVTIGSNNSSSSTIIQAGSGDVTLTSGNGNSIIVGSATADTNQILLQLDSFSTFADTATCSTTTNQGGLYYNTASNVVRGCVNGNWEDMVSTAGLGLQLFGVLPDSGTNPGDLASVTGAQNGPCKVSVGANTSTVSWKSCTAYSGGRKVLVTAGTAATSAGTSATIIFQHLCLTGTDNQPALSAVAVEASNQPVTSNTTIVTAPVLCLADIKVTNGSAVITTIYDTRTYTTSIKSPITVNTTNPTVGMLLTGTTTKGTVIPNATSPGIRFVGVIVATTGSTSTSAVNAIMAVGGPVAVKAITGTNAVNDLIIGSATAGYATTAATKTAEATTTVFNVIGLTLNAWTGATACSANADACAGSLLFNFDRR